jgi:hypothetical protein
MPINQGVLSMFRTIGLRFVLLGALGLLGTWSADGNWGTDHRFHQWYYNNVIAQWAGFGWGTASTPAEGYLRGMGAFVDSLGRLHVNNAMAAEHFQHAYEQYLRNEKLRVQTFVEIQEIRKAYADAKRKAAAEKKALRAQARVKTALRLTPQLRDPKSGAMSWPRGLMGDAFKEMRFHLEQLFNERAAAPEKSGYRTDNWVDIQSMANAMSKQLYAIRKELRSGDYLNAVHFIRVLRSEAKFRANEN